MTRGTEMLVLVAWEVALRRPGWAARLFPAQSFHGRHELACLSALCVLESGMQRHRRRG